MSHYECSACGFTLQPSVIRDVRATAKQVLLKEVPPSGCRNPTCENYPRPKRSGWLRTVED